MPAHTLAALPYAPDALAPVISEETVKFHYGKHHAGYVARLSELVANSNLASKSVVELVQSHSSVPQGVFNAAAQIFNHDFYWSSLSPVTDAAATPRKPTGELLVAIEESFGSFEAFQKEFNAAATGHFGSGWIWLVQDRKDHKLKVVQTHDAASPIQESHLIPLITLDVWEHAYYIDYRNVRVSYIDGWWKLANWEFARQNLKKSTSL
ncbi:superoxide dismutase [Fe] [Gonapodya prolifera JEL478]|uniref:Superoxide dismutase n=1 Tax=Gonapodya prolifera (strain JEL478) TaxID=1344416 RepID=A0A139ARJ4_GONPJ|nr:superoxide dismutase [Fe] [Gonapodya prolifera JEL478]|eukprot:KXS19319.1 superoxide dismutase [Fe] [Gonapodya prolifera JEL478]